MVVQCTVCVVVMCVVLCYIVLRCLLSCVVVVCDCGVRTYLSHFRDCDGNGQSSMLHDVVSGVVVWKVPHLL